MSVRLWTASTSLDVDAVVFDCDGVLMDSEGAWLELIGGWLSEFGVRRRVGDVAAYRGLSVSATAEAIAAQFGGTGAPEPHALAERMRAEYSARLAGGVPPMPGAEALVRKLHGAVPIAVASNGFRDDVLSMLTAVGLVGAFDAICTIEDVEHGKPAPDLYALATHRLGVDAARAAVFEDSPAGASAALAAGARVVAVGSEHWDEPSVHWHLASLTEVRVQDESDCDGRQFDSNDVVEPLVRR